MPAEDTFNAYDFDKYVFDCDILEESIRITIGWYQYIDPNDWNNKNFHEFIQIIKQNSKQAAKFSYIIEGEQNDSWEAKDGKIYINIWDDPGYLYDTGYVEINEATINKLENIYQSFETLKSRAK